MNTYIVSFVLLLIILKWCPCMCLLVSKVCVSLEQMDVRCEIAESWIGWPFHIFHRGWQPALQSKPYILNTTSLNEFLFKDMVLGHTIQHTDVKLPKLRWDTRNCIKIKAPRELLYTSKNILIALQTSSVLWFLLWSGKGEGLQPVGGGGAGSSALVLAWHWSLMEISSVSQEEGKELLSLAWKAMISEPKQLSGRNCGNEKKNTRWFKKNKYWLPCQSRS